MQTDETDRRILRHYLAEPGLARAGLAERAGVTPATLWRRLGYEVEVSLRFTLDKTNARAFDEFIAAARAVPEVIAIETFLGRVDVRLNVIARDMAQYQDIYRARILALPHIAEVEALMLIATIKESEGLPL